MRNTPIKPVKGSKKNSKAFLTTPSITGEASEAVQEYQVTDRDDDYR